MSTVVKADSENKALIDNIFHELSSKLDETESSLSAFDILQELGLDNNQIEKTKKYIKECKNLIEQAYKNAIGSQEGYLEEDLIYAKKLKDILDLYMNNIVSGDTNE